MKNDLERGNAMKQQLLGVKHSCIHATSEGRLDKIVILPFLFPKPSTALTFPIFKRLVSDANRDKHKT